jgi:hypothetical protein
MDADGRREIARTEEWNEILQILQEGEQDRRRELWTESVLTSNYVHDHRNAFYRQFREIEIAEEVNERATETQREWCDGVEKKFADPHEQGETSRTKIDWKARIANLRANMVPAPLTPDGTKGETSGSEIDWEDLNPNDSDAFVRTDADIDSEDSDDSDGGVSILTIDTVTKAQWEALSFERQDELLVEGITAHKAAGGETSKNFIDHIFRYDALLTNISTELV